jgi:cytochrome c553
VLSLLLVAGRGGAGAEPQAATAGRRVWLERCAPCHGDEGRGDGPAAPALEPRPRNLRDAAFWGGRSSGQLRDVVRRGKPGTMMQPFEGVLSDAEIDAVVEYLHRFRPAAGARPGAGDGEVPVAGVEQDAAGGAHRHGSGLRPPRGVHP